MAIRELSVSGYRSIRQMRLSLKQINLLTGPAGCGKSNLYNVMLLLGKAAAGGLARAIAEQGGMPSLLWAGAQKRFGHQPEPRRVILAVQTDQAAYELRCGLPGEVLPQGGADTESLLAPASQFLSDPEVVSESVRLPGSHGGRSVVMDRQGPMASIRNVEGKMVNCAVSLSPSESVLSQIPEPHLYPELSALRSRIEQWRFYHRFRTDAGSPLRNPQIGVLTPILSEDGADLAAALQTVVEIGDAGVLREEVERAFPGATLEVLAERARFRLLMHMPGVLRPLEANELSGATLRYLCLVAALLSPRPPELLALTEPEMGIHPDLIAPLARLITSASRRSQLWITTHSPALAEKIEEYSGEAPVRLTMVEGETRLA